MNEHDLFYIGYEPAMPPALRRVVATAVVAAATVAAVLAVLFVGSQERLADSRFEYGVVRAVEGYLTSAPAPLLMIRRDNGWAPHWLVATGKRGAAAALDSNGDGWVSLRGTLIERESWRMIEVQAGSVRRLEFTRQSAPPLSSSPSRQVRLRGEVVDSKCFLGVMNPGERTVHRDCAVRCLSGGVPPMFSFHDDEGSHLALLLGGDPVLLQSAVGRPIALSGTLSGPEESLVFTIGGSR
jgi:hypothetical protein